jgi:hypothetical protein
VADISPECPAEIVGIRTQDRVRGIDVFRPTYPVAEKSNNLSIDMPLLGERFEGAPRK